MSRKEQVEREIRFSVWEGKVPVKINFSSTDMGNLPKSPPQLTFDDYYCLLPRCTYFSFFLKDFIGFLFRDIIEDPDFSWSEVWLDYNGLPLKWHYPLGLLYDLFYKADFESASKDFWSITLHYGNYPVDKLFRTFQLKQQDPLPSPDFFMALNKESNYLRHGNAKKIMNLSKDDQNQLWESLLTNNFDGFWEIQSRLNDYDISLTLSDDLNTTFSEKQDPPHNLPRHVPIRLHIIEEPLLGNIFESKDKELNYPYFYQELVSPLTQGDLTEEPESKNDKPLTFTTLEQAIESIDSVSFTAPIDIIVHGVVFPLDTPLLWAYLHFMHPDGFLHIVIRLS